MKSKTSFYDKTIFKKNLTRFAPVMVLYTICLLLGMTMMYMEGSAEYRSPQNFWFASYMGQCIQVMAAVNLLFAPLVAMLLFGDLFNSRMCNALHAMPITRESYFMTNILSGLLFSLIPTAIMTVLSLPLLAGTIVQNAWQIGILWFLCANLQYLCFFGMAVFSVFCTGNRFAMALVYAALNGGAFLLCYVIALIYTPMLYGVVTPDQWVTVLTPIAKMTNGSFVELQSARELTQLFKGRESEMVANFWVTEEFWELIPYAIAGIVFLILGLLLYRKRDLEVAGDAIAFPVLAPVFQVVCAVAVAAMAPMLLNMFFSYRRNTVAMCAVLLCGLAIGWFAGKMFLERGTRVFALRNWRGLGILVAVFAVTMTLTYFDVLGFEDWVPKAEKVQSVTMCVDTCGQVELTEQEDIQKIIDLQEMAMEDHLTQSGGYPLSYVQENFEGYSNVTYPEEGFGYGEGGYDYDEEHLYADDLTLTYRMTSGREVTRSYYFWASLEEGEIVKDYMSDWDVVWENARRGWYDAFNIDQLYEISVEGKRLPEEMTTAEAAQELLDAMKADSESRTMTQSPYYHDGRFRSWNEEYQKYSYDSYLYVCIRTRVGPDDYDYTSADFEIFPDAENTINWLKEHDMLPYEIVSGNFGG